MITSANQQQKGPLSPYSMPLSQSPAPLRTPTNESDDPFNLSAPTPHSPQTRKSTDDHNTASSTTSSTPPKDSEVESTIAPEDADKPRSTSFGSRLKSTLSPKKSAKGSGSTTGGNERAKSPSRDDSTNTTAASNTVSSNGRSDEHEAEQPRSNGSSDGEENLISVINRYRREYDKQDRQKGTGDNDVVPKSMMLPHESPRPRPPSDTAIFIQEEDANVSIGANDVLGLRAGSLRESVETIERTAPGWVGKVMFHETYDTTVSGLKKATV